MQDIYLDKIKLHNCRHHTDMEMDFPSGLTVIIGKNGSGKSTIPKAVSMALYGDDGSISGERLAVANMVNKKAKKDLEIILDFRIVENEVTDNYQIQLYHEHKKFRNKLVLTKNGIDISGKSKTETYEYISKITYPRDIYHNTVYFSQHVKDFFTSLTNTDQKKIFDAILSTQEYVTFYNNTFQKEKIIAEFISNLDSKISNLETTISIKGDQTLKSLISAKESAEKSNSTMLASLIDQRVSNENSYQVLTEDLANNTFDQNALDRCKAVFESILIKKNSREEDLQAQFKQLESKFKSDLEKDLLILNSSFDKKRSAVDSEFHINERKIDEELKKIYNSISVIESKYDTSQLRKDYNLFLEEKQKETAYINNEIRALDNVFSTSTIESELRTRLEIISKNESDLKDESSNIRSSAATIKSTITAKENSIKEDESSLNQTVPICSKCLRPFIGTDNGNIIKESVEKTKSEISQLNSQIDGLREEMGKLKIRAEELQKDKTKLEEDYKARIQVVLEKKKEQTEILNRKINLIQDEKNVFKKEIEDKIQEITLKKQNELSSFESEKKNLESKISILKASVSTDKASIDEEFTKESLKIKSEHNIKYTTACSDIKSKVNSELEELNKRIEESTLNISSFENSKSRFETIKHSLEVLKIELNSLNVRIDECKKFKYDNTQIDKINIELIEHTKDLVSINKEKLMANRELQILGFWKEAFSDTGIKSMIMDMAIPDMNDSVRQALDRIVPGVFTVSFDTLKMNKSGDVKDKFNVNILHNVKGTDSYKELSGGERRLIDLCCMKSLTNLTEKLYGKRIHNAFYDEVLDSLDDDSCQAFGQALKLLSNDMNITLITHKATENVEPDRIFTF